MYLTVPDVGLKPASLIVLYVSSLQYVTGSMFIGLFGYVLGSRIRRWILSEDAAHQA